MTSVAPRKKQKKPWTSTPTTAFSQPNSQVRATRKQRLGNFNFRRGIRTHGLSTRWPTLPACSADRSAPAARRRSASQLERRRTEGVQWSSRVPGLFFQFFCFFASTDGQFSASVAVSTANAAGSSSTTFAAGFRGLSRPAF